jgi:hypothetical protein
LTNRTQNPGWHWPEGIGLGIYAGMRAPMSRNNWITSKMRNIVALKVYAYDYRIIFGASIHGIYNLLKKYWAWVG